MFSGTGTFNNANIKQEPKDEEDINKTTSILIEIEIESPYDCSTKQIKEEPDNQEESTNETHKTDLYTNREMRKKKVKDTTALLPEAKKGTKIGNKQCNQEEIGLSCYICAKAFVSNYNLKRHQRLHAGELPFQCAICKKRFTDTGLKSHQRVHKGLKPFKCGICNKNFSSKNHLQSHQKIHTGEKTFSCEICKKRFTLRHHLLRHQQSHARKEAREKSPRFACEVCDETFFYKYHLQCHLKIHKGEKLFSCQFCEKSFLFQNYLLRHERSHTGEKPFKCEFCNKQYAANYNLVRHLQVHTGK